MKQFRIVREGYECENEGNWTYYVEESKRVLMFKYWARWVWASNHTAVKYDSKEDAMDALVRYINNVHKQIQCKKNTKVETVVLISVDKDFNITE